MCKCTNRRRALADFVLEINSLRREHCPRLTTGCGCIIYCLFGVIAYVLIVNSVEDQTLDGAMGGLPTTSVLAVAVADDEGSDDESLSSLSSVSSQSNVTELAKKFGFKCLEYDCFQLSAEARRKTLWDAIRQEAREPSCHHCACAFGEGGACGWACVFCNKCGQAFCADFFNRW